MSNKLLPRRLSIHNQRKKNIFLPVKALHAKLLSTVEVRGTRSLTFCPVYYIFARVCQGLMT